LSLKGHKTPEVFFKPPQKAPVASRYQPFVLLNPILKIIPLIFWLGAHVGAPAVLSAAPQISLITPEKRGGKAYRMVYSVDVPLDVFWRFKTDFDNDFLVSNKYILSHVLIKKTNSIVVTENRYTSSPDVTFRWQTRLYPDQYRLDFKLLNPHACGQKFHYGHIQAENSHEKTRVTQVAYFDFFGASLWVNFPWAGGMNAFLSETATWEQQMVLKRKHLYRQPARE